MRIDEILRISTQDFPIRNVQKLLPMTKDGYGTIDDLQVRYLESGDERIIILSNGDKIAAFAGFISRLNGKVWQAKNLQTYGEYRGNNLGAKIYKYVKEIMKKSIQSDVEQSSSAEKLWTKTLPSLGIYPKIFDTETEYIIDESNPNAYRVAIEKLYTSNENDPDKFRYTWILEQSDHYAEHSILKENQLLMPYTGIWYNFKT
jgi:hypothetical protein